MRVGGQRAPELFEVVHAGVAHAQLGDVPIGRQHVAQRHQRVVLAAFGRAGHLVGALLGLGSDLDRAIAQADIAQFERAKVIVVSANGVSRARRTASHHSHLMAANSDAKSQRSLSLSSIDGKKLRSNSSDSFSVQYSANSKFGVVCRTSQCAM